MARSKHKAVTLPLCGDTGSAKLVQTEHGELGVLHVRQADGRRFHVRATDQHHRLGGVLQPLPPPIDEALKRGNLTEDQHHAATRYASSYRVAFSGAVKAISYDDRGPSSPSDNWRVSNNQAEAMHAWNAARKSVIRLSRQHLAILDFVVIDEIPANHAAKRTGYIPRNGIGMLRQALDALVAHYGTSRNARFQEDA